MDLGTYPLIHGAFRYLCVCLNFLLKYLTEVFLTKEDADIITTALYNGGWAWVKLNDLSRSSAKGKEQEKSRYSIHVTSRTFSAPRCAL